MEKDINNSNKNIGRESHNTVNTNNTNTTSKSFIDDGKILKMGREFTLEDFDIIKELGHGAYAKVYLSLHKQDKVEFALKTITKNNIIREGKLYQLFLETELMLMLNNDFIASMHGAFEENKKLILVMDYYKNGDLFDFIAVNSMCFLYNS